MRIGLGQINPVVGDVAGNTRKIARCIDRAVEQGAELVAFSELAVTGYPPRDLLSRSELVAASVRAVDMLAARCKKVAALVGFVRPAGETPGRPLENAAALLAGGEVQGVHVKTLLPTYDVFDETRYFRPGPTPEPMVLGADRFGVTICEDLWDRLALGRDLYESDPIGHLRSAGAETIFNLAASPFTLGKVEVREELIRRQAVKAGTAIAYINQAGGDDELIFDGGSMMIAADGSLLGRCKSFQEDLLVVDTAGPAGRCSEPGGQMEQLHLALTLGLRDYVHKCGFASVLLGLSGGIDSAVVATLAVDALGPDNVLGLAMPSRHSSSHSLTDARQLADTLRIKLIEIGIDPIHRAYEAALATHLPSDRPAVTDENIQARIRGNLVMAFSNALGHLPLATGNKSELATGYCTLYGDMCGGLCVIGDVPKNLVYKLARHLNEIDGPRIPESSITKPPSAELKPDQTDQQKLPPYDVLDEILHRYIAQEKTLEQIADEGFDADLTRSVIEMIQAAEYKRRQAAPVLKVSSRAFGAGRRVPIAFCRDPQSLKLDHTLLENL